jgi:hypothetical protein
MAKSKAAKREFEIFRAKDAPTLTEEGCMTIVPFDPAALVGVAKLMRAGFGEGESVKVLVNIPGFSLTHVWFKKDFPLPLHSHDADCLYYIVAGSLRLGTEELGPRDCFFVPADVPYGYKPGPDGVELLEFRHANAFNFVNHAKGKAFWDKALAAVSANQEEWKAAKMPALNG